MVSQYFYGRGVSTRLGPYSGQQLKDLADSGKILPSDTIWKVGVKQGMLAKHLKNLFSQEQEQEHLRLSELSAPAEGIQSAIPDEKAMPDELTQQESVEILHQLEIPDVEVQKPVPAAPSASRHQEKQRVLKAVAVRGAVIVSQDGVYVRFKKKCTQCGQEDNCMSRLAIRNGSNVATFFCPKCRKQRQVELRGSQSAY